MKKQKPINVCDGCGSEFDAVPSAKRRFCSGKCYHVWYRQQRLAKSNEIFWSRVDRTGDCWVWKLKPATKFGYCRFSKMLAHRKAWEITHGPIPKGMQVCHHCDNPKCVRPEHLFLGTQEDNVHDMMGKGRMKPTASFGEKNHSAKITSADVNEIRKLAVTGIKQVRIAERFGVSTAQISRIINKKTRLSC